MLTATGTAEKQLLLMLSPCLNNIKKKQKKKQRLVTCQKDVNSRSNQAFLAGYE